MDILVLGFCGTLAGCDDFVEIADWATDNAEFFGTFLELPNGIPSHDTFNGWSRANRAKSSDFLVGMG